MKESKNIKLEKYVQKNIIETEAGKYLVYAIIGVGILWGSKYVFNSLAGSIRAFKNFKKSITE